MKRELLNIEGGKIKKGNNVIFDDLSLELFQGEITGIVFDDILEAPYRSMILDNMSATENVSVPLHEKVRGFSSTKR